MKATEVGAVMGGDVVTADYGSVQGPTGRRGTCPNRIDDRRLQPTGQARHGAADDWLRRP
ncbi:hypothetical protein AB0F07_36545 [Streptomyces fructofermentans]|uniref:hypothetical protein n=1 Tax=Streptomyces fructofermentans TaxID=152141 RepID=UPI0034056194